jgi:GAF domain-containing protein
MTPSENFANDAPAAAVPELVSLLLTTRSVETFLEHLAGTAATTLGASCGITIRRGDQPLTVASSDALAAAVDEVQYGEGQGPCLHSMSSGEVVSVPDVSKEVRWGGYPAYATAHGVRSSLSLPLVDQGEISGALNLYGTTISAFDDPADVARATTFAAQGGAVLGVAVRQAKQAQLTEQLREALSSRAIIDQAIGVLMAQQRCSADDAFAILRRASQNRNRKLRDIASDIVTSVGGRPVDQAPFSDPV